MSDDVSFLFYLLDPKPEGKTQNTHKTEWNVFPLDFYFSLVKFSQICLDVFELLKISISRLESYNDPHPSTNQSTSLKSGLTLRSVCFVCTYVLTDGHHQQK